jgi:hypothetical protein
MLNNKPKVKCKMPQKRINYMKFTKIIKNNGVNITFINKVNHFIFNMFPSDPKGSLDAFYNLLNQILKNQFLNNQILNNQNSINKNSIQARLV